MDAGKPLLMDQVQFAKHRGKTKQYINKLVKAGVLVHARRQDRAPCALVLPAIGDSAPRSAAQEPTAGHIAPQDLECTGRGGLKATQRGGA
jgi:hypothetical protein